MPRRVVLITNVGAIPQRIIDNISEIRPHLVVFSQQNPGWNETNPKYKVVLERFFKDPLIQDYEKRGKLEMLPVETLLLYECVFKALYNKVREYQNGSEIVIDISGFTKEATAAALHVATCFENVTAFYARGERDDKYDERKYNPSLEERSGQLLPIPVPRVNIRLLQDEGPQYYAVFKAVYAATKQGTRKCTNRDVAEQLSGKHSVLSKERRISITMTLHTLKNYGLLKMEYVSGRCQEIELTPFGIGIANALFGASNA